MSTKNKLSLNSLEEIFFIQSNLLLSFAIRFSLSYYTAYLMFLLNFTRKTLVPDFATKRLKCFTSSIDQNMHSSNLIFFLNIKLAIFFLCIHGNLLVILLKSCQIFTCFGEFTLFHTFSNVPVYKGALSIHEIKFVINTG